MVTKAPILAHYKQGLRTIMEANSSDYVSSRVLFQLGKDRLLYLVAFFFKNLNPAECNYEIYDKELLAIIQCFEQWRPELEATGVPIKVITDHKSLEYFMTTKKLSRRQARWAEFLSGFNFVISYTPGRENGKADSLTRRPNDCPADDQDDRQQHLLQTILPPERLEISTIDPDKSKTTPERMIQANLVDPYYTKLRKTIRTSSSIEGINTRHLSDLFIDTKDCIRQFNRLWVPDNLQLTVIRDVHDQIATGHPDYQKTISLIFRNYYWPGLKKMV